MRKKNKQPSFIDLLVFIYYFFIKTIRIIFHNISLGVWP